MKVTNTNRPGRGRGTYTKDRQKSHAGEKIKIIGAVWTSTGREEEAEAGSQNERKQAAVTGRQLRGLWIQPRQDHFTYLPEYFSGI